MDDSAAAVDSRLATWTLQKPSASILAMPTGHAQWSRAIVCKSLQEIQCNKLGWTTSSKILDQPWNCIVHVLKIPCMRGGSCTHISVQFPLPSSACEFTPPPLKGLVTDLWLAYSAAQALILENWLFLYVLCIAGVALAIAVVIIIGLAADLGVEKSQADSSSAVGAATCTTPGCIDASAEILSHLDESIDPCEDYQPVCLQWICWGTNTPIWYVWYWINFVF